MEEKSWLIQYLPQILIVVGVLFTALGGWISFSRTIKYRANNLELGNTNKTLNQTNQALNLLNLTKTEEVKSISKANSNLSLKNKELITKNSTLTIQNKELIETNINIANSNSELSKQLIKRAEEINYEVTGGDSYLMVYIDFKPKTFEFDITAIVDGMYSMYNINVDIDLLTESGPEKILKSTIPVANTMTPYELGKSIKLPDGKNEVFFTISTSSKNGHNTQYTLFKKAKDGIWYRHTVYFQDIASWFRGEEYYPNPYPEYLNKTKPLISDYVKYDKQNRLAIDNATKMLKEGIMSIQEIRNLTSVPINKLKDIFEEIEASK